MKHYYPAIFTPKGNGLEGFTLEFPDIPGCFTMGDDMEECLWMAQDAVGLMLDDLDEKNYPAPSNVGDIDLSDYPAGSFVNVIEFDTEKYFHTVRYVASKAGLNIKQTAELLGAPYRTVQNWFSGKTRPTPWVERLVVEKIQGTL